MLDRFLEAGGTFIDTADVYGDGESERTLAPWLARHRSEVVLAAEGPLAVSDPGGEGLNPDRIRAACNAEPPSPRRGHDRPLPSARTRPDRPAGRLAALNGLVQAGKVPNIGASNFPAWLLAWSVSTQDREGWAPFVSLQPQYSLVEHFCRAGVDAISRAARLGVVGTAGAFLARLIYSCEHAADGRVTLAGDDWRSRQPAGPSSAISE